MIFDWIKNCQKILDTNHLSDNDNDERSELERQELVLVKYLQEQNIPKDQIYTILMNLDNEVLITNMSISNTEDNLYTKDYWFERILKSSKAQIINTNKNKCQYNVPIYQEELDVINSASELTDVEKKFLFVLLVMVKFNGEKRWTNRISSWVRDKLGVGANNQFFRTLIQKRGVYYMNKKLGLKVTFCEGKELIEIYHPVYTEENMSSANIGKKKTEDDRFALTFVKTSGTVVTTVYDPNDAFNHFEKIGSIGKVCSQCGNRFISSPKSKTSLCPECYKKHRSEFKKQNDCRGRHDKADTRVSHHPTKKGGGQEK